MAGVSVEIDDAEINQDPAGASGGFSWESRYTQSWEILREDDSGTLQPTLAMLVQRDSEYLRRRRMTADAALRRGIMRHIVILIDWSVAASTVDVSEPAPRWRAGQFRLSRSRDLERPVELFEIRDDEQLCSPVLCSAFV